MSGRFWHTPRIVIDEERFAGLEHRVEPQGAELLLYMTNGMTAVLHPLLQGQTGASFVPALIAMYTLFLWVIFPTRRVLTYTLKLYCCLWAVAGVYYISKPDIIPSVRANILWLEYPWHVAEGYQPRLEDGFILDYPLDVDDTQSRIYPNVHSSPNSYRCW